MLPLGRKIDPVDLRFYFRIRCIIDMWGARKGDLQYEKNEV